MTRGLMTVLAGATLASVAVAQDVPPPGSGRRGTSGEERDDTVGSATLLDLGAGATATATPTVRIAVMHRTLPAGSFVEVTALDTGRAIAAMVVGPYLGRGVVGLSRDAAQALGIVEGAAVRVRPAAPSPQDQAALRRGEAAGMRLDAPPALLTALRKRAGGVPPPERHESAARTPGAQPAAAMPEPIRRGYGVQVAALSSPERADALARTLGGSVVPAGRLYRVQLGPFADTAAAGRARAAVARHGHADARVFHSE